MSNTESEDIQKDIELLRNEHQQLSTTIQRICSLRLLFLFLFTFTFGSALQKIQSLDNAEIVAARNQLVDRLQTIHGGPIDLKTAPFISDSCPAGVNAYAIDHNTGQGISVDFRYHVEIDSMARRLCGLYGKAFSTSIEVLGLKLELDLRHWIYVLPILYWLTAVYLFSLRKKLKVIDMLAKHRIQQVQPGTVSSLDALLFLTDQPGGTAYSRVPMEFLNPLYSQLMFVFFLYLGISFAPVLAIFAAETDFELTLGHVILILITCTLIYTGHVAKRLEAQADKVAGCSLGGARRPYLKAMQLRFIAWWRRRAISVRSWSFPRTYLLSGSLLILMTVGLATTLDSCGSAYKGYELARGKDDWVGAVEYAQSSKGLNHGVNQVLGRGAYLASLSLAAVSLGVLVLSIRKFTVLSSRRLMGGAFIVAAVIASFVLSQLSFIVTMSWDSPEGAVVSWVWALYWVAGSLVWCRFALVAIREGKLQWPSHSLLVVIYLPQITVLLSLTIAMAMGDPRPYGLVAYLLGIHLLSLAYALYLARACHVEVSGTRAT
jgi:hypothetical protein